MNNEISGVGEDKGRGIPMQVHSGHAFFVDCPTLDEITIEDIAEALSKTCRYNGHCKGFYSVAEHSVLVAALVPREHCFEALLHDAAEAYLGDIVRPIKHRLGGYREMEARVHRAIARKFGISEEISEVVHRADLMALAIEKRDIMNPEVGHVWGPLPEPPENVKAHGLEWQSARQLFLNAFYQYAAQGRRHDR